MYERNIINLEAIDECLAQMAAETRDVPLELVFKALRRPMLNDHSLFAAVDSIPKAAPAWVTAELVATGTLERFEPQRLDYDMIVQIVELMRWLRRGHGKTCLSERDRRKWTKSLGHIRTLEEASRMAAAQMTAWGERDVRAHRQEREALRRRHIKKPASFAAQIAHGQIVERVQLDCATRWYQLMTVEALATEDIEMSHCVGSYFYRSRLERGEASFYSLRSDDLSRCLTLMVMRDGHFEARGAGNRPPNEEDEQRIAQFMKTEIPLGIAKGVGIHIEPPMVRRPKILRRSSTLARFLLRMHGQLNERRAQQGIPARPMPRHWRIIYDVHDE